MRDSQLSEILLRVVSAVFISVENFAFSDFLRDMARVTKVPKSMRSPKLVISFGLSFYLPNAPVTRT